MPAAAIATRVVLAVLDGLRPDAIDTFDLRHWRALARSGAETRAGRSVEPSLTAAAMTSLFSGVRPDVHGIDDERFRLPRAPHRLPLLTRTLAAAGVPSAVHIRRVPWWYRPLARRLASVAGAGLATMRGDDAPAILEAARPTLERGRPGFTFLHFPDADAAGHAHGWMSAPYGAAARRLDDTLGRLADLLTLDRGDTVLIACADHGGGGVEPTHHRSAHPLDRTIPIVLAGAGVQPGRLADRAGWMDLPPTVAWLVGAPRPAAWPGRPLTEAFAPRVVAAA